MVSCHIAIRGDILKVGARGGRNIGEEATVADERLAGWVAIAPPLRILPLDELTTASGTDPRPKLLIVPEHDQFRPPEAAAEATASWNNSRIEAIAGADHFLVGRTDKVAGLVAAFVEQLGLAN